jgi:hypothetical protein
MQANRRFTFASLPAIASALLLAASAASCSGATPAAASAGAPAAASLAWTSFQDPFEKAFTVEVPQGWTARGGLFRMGYSDARAMVDLTSPDGRINVRIGDISIPTYTAASQDHAREGEIVDLGAQAQLEVARYRTGPEFAVHYSHVRFYQSCRNPVADSADAGFTVPDYLKPMSDTTQSSTGSISYRCAAGANGGSDGRIAFAFVRTSAQGDLWEAQTLASFISPSDRVALARAVLDHCARTFHRTQQWIAYQNQEDADGLTYQRARQQRRLADLARQVQQFDAQMAAMRSQMDAFRRHEAAQSAQVESFTQALRGVTPTLDPLTGEAREVWTGPSSSYWSNGAGAVVNSNGAPAAGWHQLQVNGP